VTLPRGFKSEAERIALDLRTRIGADPRGQLDLHRLAKELGVRVVAADTLVGLDRLEEIERLQAFAFSACTFDIHGAAVIVYNPLRTEARRVSDIAHELAHIILKHDLSEIQELDGVPFRTCQADQEEQATAFAGTLLLPRPLLLDAARNGESFEDLARRLGVTVDMARFRWHTTGVERQATASQARRR
jgi:Zn-dependent peptidase ImmA (M78 family)